jgi:HD-like signal output (HDOD) protein
MKRVLFVDDEPMVLDGLRRMLHGMGREWEMEFVSSGEAALQSMAAKPADVVVSDMRMPNMTGAELLNEVLRRYPRTVRFILSGYSEIEMIMQCVGGTHQFLSKPCDGETLRSLVRRAVGMDSWMNDDRVKTLVAGMKTVPSLPALYFQILEQLRSPESTLDKVGETIAQDPAMTAKMLQLVNSAFFGLRRQMNNATEAVGQLGLETVKSLVLAIHVFSELDSRPGTKLQVEGIYHHSLATAGAARRIAQLEGADRRILEECFTAGLLHDIGRLVLVANAPEQYKEALARAQAESIPLTEAERAVFGVSHAEVGGYLLGLWGLPVPIAEAAVFHHCPAPGLTKRFTSLTAVHVANVLKQGPGQPGAVSPQLDEKYLVETGLWGRAPIWREALAKSGVQ